MGVGRCWKVLRQPGISSDSAREIIEGEAAFGLAMVWAYPYQACLSSLDEVAKKLSLLINSGDDWAYAFVQLNEDTQHVPLHIEGHLSTMIEEVPSRNVCGHLHQLEVHWLLQHEDWVVYPEGLNGGLEPVLISLWGALVKGMNMLGDLPTNLHSYQWTSPRSHWETLHPWSWLPAEYLHQPPLHLTMECHPKADSHISMTSEVWELLSHTILDTSSQALGGSTPKRPTSLALGISSPTRAEDSSKPVATSSQASLWAAMPDNTKPIIQPPKVVCTPTTLPTKTPGADMDAPPWGSDFT